MALELSEFLSEIENRPYVVIDLGCGPRKKKDSLGIDHSDLPGVDFVVDLENGLPFLKDNSIDKFTTSHFLEHIANLEQMMKDIHRCLKPDGIIEIIVPHFSNPYGYSDYTHKRFFGLYTFDYFSGLERRYRKDNFIYDESYRFRVLSRRLVTRSPYFGILQSLKKHVINPLINASPYTQKLYEDSFCYIIPCYELHFVLKPAK